MKVRQDIQCLRGIAIISVVAYHLFPSIFANGYLGVDMFFVISGYLMARNLTHSKIERVWDILMFYYKRLKRILPTYYLVIFFTVVSLHFYFCDFWWETNYRYSLASLFCITNQLIIHDSADYFREFLADGTSLNAFIHFWSLGVEIQFYLLVPFIFYGLQFLKHDVIRFSACLLMMSTVMIAYTVINQQFAFNFMFLRLWQFSAGFSSLFLSKIEATFCPIGKEKSENVKLGGLFYQDDVTCVAIATLALVFVPIKFNAQIVRPIITIFTAFIIYLEDSNHKILNSNNLSYIGDLSYVIYLVHWPVITMVGGVSMKAHVLSIVATMIISVFLYHIYEKQYLKTSMRSVSILVLFLIAANGVLQYSIRNHIFWKQPYPEEMRGLINKNEAMLPHYWETHKREVPCESTTFEDAAHGVRIFGYCKYPRGNGKLNISVIGNSYTLMLGDFLRDSFKNQNYSNFDYMPIGEGYALYEDSVQSKLAIEIFKRHVKKNKPDILFIAARFSNPPKEPYTNDTRDTLIDQFNENIRYYEKFVKYIFILGPHQLYNGNFANYFMQYLLQRPDDIEDLHTSKKEADMEMYHIRKRFGKIECEKCEVFDMSQQFADGKKYLNFDRDTLLSYADNSVHLTAAGLEVVRPIIENITQTILNSF